MGYETKLIFGEVLTFDPDEVKTILEIGRIDLSKAGYSTTTGEFLAAERKAATVHYRFFADNGNDRIDRDPYDEPIPAVNIDGLIAAMESDQEDDEYRRFTLALAALRVIRSWPNVVVLAYGH